MAMSKAQKAKVKNVATKLKGASKAHAGQAKTLMGMMKKTKKRAK